MLTAERLAEIRERCNRATRGPWHEALARFYAQQQDRIKSAPRRADGHPDIPEGTVVWKFVDIAFAANARDDVSALLDEVKRLKQALAQSAADTLERCAAVLERVEAGLPDAVRRGVYMRGSLASLLRRLDEPLS